jgi:hypothetical protein
MMPGTPERRSHDHVRHATNGLFALPIWPATNVIGSPKVPACWAERVREEISPEAIERQ